MSGKLAKVFRGARPGSGTRRRRQAIAAPKRLHAVPRLRREQACYSAVVGALAACGLFAAAVSAQVITQTDWTPPPEGDATIWEEMERPLQESLERDVEMLIDQLGSPSYEERLAARSRLMDVGPRAFPQLRAAYVETDDLESRLQIEEIVHDSYLDFFVYGRNAFLGIQQHQHPATRDEDLRIQPGHVGIRIHQVISDTAAQRSGFEAGDIIIALDGEPIPQRGIQANLAFGESIRVRGPGAQVTFTILRNDEEIEKTVVLGSRPKRYYQRQGIVSNMLDYFRGLFDDFWLAYFGSAEAKTVEAAP